MSRTNPGFGPARSFSAIVLMLLFGGATLSSATPTVTRTPTSGPPTRSISVGGEGFGAAEAVDIYFDTTDLALAVTNSSGAFSGISIRVPASAVPGEHWVTAVGRRSRMAGQKAFTVQTNWKEFHRGPLKEGHNDLENVLSPANVPGLHSLWSAATGRGIVSSPAVADGVVYIGSYDWNLYAFNQATGTLLWRVAPSLFPLHSSPAVANGVVYVGSTDYNLYAFNAATGSLLWTGATFGQINSSPAVANGVVYIGSDDTNLYAFNAATGSLLWNAGNAGSIFSSPAVADGVVYAGSLDNSLYAFKAATGVRLWSAATGGPIYDSSPAVANGVVYVGSYDRNLYAFNAHTGSLLWSVATGADMYSSSSPAVANGVVYVGSDNGDLYAFDAATGSLLWSAATGNAIYSSPAVANGVVYVGSYDNNLYAFALPTPAAATFAPPERPEPTTLRPDLKLIVRP